MNKNNIWKQIREANNEENKTHKQQINKHISNVQTEKKKKKNGNKNCKETVSIVKLFFANYPFKRSIKCFFMNSVFSIQSMTNNSL